MVNYLVKLLEPGEKVDWAPQLSVPLSTTQFLGSLYI